MVGGVILLALAALHLRPCSGGLSYPLPDPVNAAPTIGVLSVPMQQAGSPCDTETAGAGAGSSCFTSFYFHWLQSTGARAVILPVDADLATLDALLDSVNGVLFTGGSLENLTWSNPYMVAAGHIYKRVLEKNGNGTFFPLHGTCQGFQVLMLLTSQDQSVLQYNAFDSEDLVMPLDISVRSLGALAKGAAGLQSKRSGSPHCHTTPTPQHAPFLARAVGWPPLQQALQCGERAGGCGGHAGQPEQHHQPSPRWSCRGHF